jgi:hypothetical protein
MTTRPAPADHQGAAESHGPELVQSLVLFLRTARYYGAEHQALKAPITQLLQVLSRFEKEGHGEVVLFIAGQAFFVGGHLVPLRGSQILLGGTLRDLLTRAEAGGIRFQGVPSEATVRAFADGFWRLLLGESTDLKTRPPAGMSLEKPRFTKPIKDDEEEQRESALELYARLLADTERWMVRRPTGATLDTKRLKRSLGGLVDSLQADPDRVLGLLSLRMFRGEQFNHQVNMSVLSLRLGHAVGYEREPLTEVGMVSLVHDFGDKSKEVLSCDSPPEAAAGEALGRAASALSVRAGYSTRRLATLVAYEKAMPIAQGGQGFYSQAAEPHPVSKIAAVTDAFEVYTTGTSAKRGLAPDVALRTMMTDIGRKYDPLVLKLFINVLGLFPVGTPVRLTDGRNGVVVAGPTGATAARPRLRILDGKGEGTVVDLAQASHSGIAIAHALDPDEITTNVTQFFTL